MWVAGAALAGQFSVGWANDWLDADRDRLTGRRDKPLATGLLRDDTVRTAALVALTLAVPLSLASGLRATAVHLLAIGLGWAYNLWVKGTSWSVVPYAGAFALLPVFVSLGLPGESAGPWWSPVAAGLLGAGAHFLNALPDLADDAAAGVRGLPQRLGPVGSLVAGATLLGGGLLVVAVGPDGGITVARAAGLAVGLACVAGAVLTGLRGRPRLAFPLAMGAAGAVVVALLGVATQL